MLERAARDWGLESSRTRLLRDGLNHVYAAEREDGGEVVIRVSDAAHRSVEQIESELFWLDHLSRHGCRVPTPVRTREGELLESFDQGERGFHVALFERIAGHDLWCRYDVLSTPEFPRQIGKLVGRVHRLSEGLEFPADRERGEWYEETECMVPEHPADCYDLPTIEAMSSYQQALIEKSKRADPRHYGLVHRDVTGLNLLYDRGELTLLDFELGCRFWRVADLSPLLWVQFVVPSWQEDGADAEGARNFVRRFAEGYREEHPLDGEQLQLLPDLMPIREILFYVLAKPHVEKWDDAIPHSRVPLSETIAWMERRWQNGPPDYGFDFDGL